MLTYSLFSRPFEVVVLMLTGEEAMEDSACFMWLMMAVAVARYLLHVFRGVGHPTCIVCSACVQRVYSSFAFDGFTETTSLIDLPRFVTVPYSKLLHRHWGFRHGENVLRDTTWPERSLDE